ncbi:MAG: DUF6807 family protein [Gemmataceae bacterium]
MRHILSALTFLLLPLPALADQTVKFTVSAGKHDRANEPVVVPLNLEVKTPVLASAEVKDDKGNFVAVGQLPFPDLVTDKVMSQKGKERRDLVFVLPKLKAGESLNLKAVIADEPRKPSPGDFVIHGQVTTDQQWAELRQGKRPVWRYMHTPYAAPAKGKENDTGNPTSKVFHHVYDPSGERFVTNGAGGHFPHHRGLFYGFSKTSYGKNTVDIWHCRASDPKGKRKNEAHQAHAGVLGQSLGPVLGRQILDIDWHGVGTKTFAKEQRELTAYAVPGGTLIDFASKLTPTGDPVKLDGDPQHAGFHFRAANEVNDKTAKQTTFIRPDGTDKPGATRNWDGKKNTSHVNLPWLAMSFVLGGQRYTAAYLDRPDNPKEARFSERDYGRFGSYFVTTVTKEKPLLVRYRVWLQEGQMTPEDVKAKSVQFVEPVEVRLK